MNIEQQLDNLIATCTEQIENLQPQNQDRGLAWQWDFYRDILGMPNPDQGNENFVAPDRSVGGQIQKLQSLRDAIAVAKNQYQNGPAIPAQDDLDIQHGDAQNF